MKHRSSIQIMGRLIGLVKPLAPFMILAVLMGVAGFLTAILITVFGGFAILQVLGNPAGIPLGTVFTLRRSARIPAIRGAGMQSFYRL